MNKKRTILLALIAFVAGAIGGIYCSSYFWGKFSNELIISSAAANASLTVHNLRYLRATNTTEVVKLLEIQLDSSLSSLGAFLPELPASQRDPTYLKAIQRAKDYRTEFPYTNSSPEVSEAILQAFNLVNVQTNQ